MAIVPSPVLKVNGTVEQSVRLADGDLVETSEGEDSEESVGEIDDALEDAIAESIED